MIRRCSRAKRVPGAAGVKRAHAAIEAAQRKALRAIFLMSWLKPRPTNILVDSLPSCARASGSTTSRESAEDVIEQCPWDGRV